MTTMTTAAARPTVRDAALTVAWFFRIDGADPVKWDWRAPPPAKDLAPVRTPRSSASNRHIPVTAHSMTNGGVVHLESGLEHDLLRTLDRDPGIAAIVAQPLRLSWSAPMPTSHTPDLLTVRRDGEVTVWDVRAAEQQDDDFAKKSAVARDACAVVGWRYEVFTGCGITERLNRMWLNGFRRRPEWTHRYDNVVREAARQVPTTIGRLFALDDGSGELKAIVWHLLWCGVLQVDMTEPWDLDTSVSMSAEAGHD